MTDSTRYEAAVIGGGLAGLTAAVILGRAGARTVLLERAPRFGGRGDTHVERGFSFNLGPRAVFRAGIGARILESLIGPLPGGVPGAGTFGLSGGRFGTLPAGMVSLLRTPFLGWRGRFEVARFLSRLSSRPLEPLRGVSVRDLLESEIASADARLMVEMFVRVASYADDPERLSAEVALERIRLGLRGVLYVDGGWATLVSRLREAAAAAGVELRSGARAVRVEEAGGSERVILGGGASMSVSAAVLAVSPGDAASLAPDAPSLARFAGSAVPVKAACLDVGLTSLPDPSRAVVLGIDEPLYLSVHSKVAALAPSGGATIHVMRYLGARGPSPSDERELEGLLDRAQPGWRERVVVRRFLSAMTVAHALPIAARGGVAERPGPAIADRPGLFVAGDWVGPAGWLLDASLASASQAARLALGRVAAANEAGEPDTRLRAAS